MKTIDLITYQSLYLQTVYDYFHQYGAWPNYSYVKRRFLEVDPNLDVKVIKESLPARFRRSFLSCAWDRPGLLDAFIILTIPALCYYGGAEEELTDFVRVIRFFVERYTSPNKKDRYISSNGLVAHLGLSELAVQKFGLLYLTEPPFFKNYTFYTRSRKKGDWKGELDEIILRFGKVTSILEYVVLAESLEVPRLSFHNGRKMRIQDVL